MNILKTMYVLAIAALLTILVIFGISAFYDSPGGFPVDVQSCTSKGCHFPWRDYARNVFSISYGCGLLFVILGLVLPTRLNIIKLGLLLGGIATIVYAMAQPHLANELRFVGVAVGLVILLYLGYKLSPKRKRVSEEKT